MFNLAFFKVEGDSMLPKIPCGSFVLVNKQTCNVNYKNNSILVFYHQIYGNLIKKLDYIDKSKRLWFSGSNKESIARNKIGPIQTERIIGKAILVITRNKIFFSF